MSQSSGEKSIAAESFCMPVGRRMVEAILPAMPNRYFLKNRLKDTALSTGMSGERRGMRKSIRLTAIENRASLYCSEPQVITA